MYFCIFRLFYSFPSVRLQKNAIESQNLDVLKCDIYLYETSTTAAREKKGVSTNVMIFFPPGGVGDVCLDRNIFLDRQLDIGICLLASSVCGGRVANLVRKRLPFH